MRITYICQYFPPEIGAPSARVSEMAREWAAAGHEVTVVTGMPNHPTGIVPPHYRGRVFCKEALGAVAVWRNWIYATPNEGFVKKSLSHLSFMLSVLVLSGPRLRSVDVLVVSSPTFFVVLSTYLLSRLWRIPYVFEVRDLWPGIFVELGVLKPGLVLRALTYLELFLYRRAARVVVVTEAFKTDLTGRGIPAERVVTITNGVDTEYFQPASRDQALRAEHRLGNSFVALYIGAHGISHALEAILLAAHLLRDVPDLTVLFVGEGAEKAKLQARAAELGLTNVRFLPGQPKALMPAWYATADAVFVPLRNIPLFDGFIPSKMFEIMACARPIVASVRGESRAILERAGAAVIVDPEDAAGIAGAVRGLIADEVRREALGRNGRAFVIAHYTRARLAARYADLLAEVVHRR